MPPKRINVKALREGLGLSQVELAKRIWGAHKTYAEGEHRARTIRRWENGDTTPVGLHRQALERLVDEHKHRGAPQRLKAHAPDADGDHDSDEPGLGPSMAS